MNLKVGRALRSAPAVRTAVRTTGWRRSTSPTSLRARFTARTQVRTEHGARESWLGKVGVDPHCFVMKISLVVLLAVAGSGVTLSAANWPSWRGPDQNNQSPEKRFPTRWSKEENIKWRTALPEPGNSSPIVWENTVFITQAVEDGRRRTVMSFDRTNGRLRWQQGVEFGAKDPRHEMNPHCAASPVTDGNRVVASFGSAGIVAYDFAGNLQWKADLGPQTHEWGQGSSPVLHRDQVLVYHGPGPHSALYALDKKTGRQRWVTPLPEAQPAERFDGFAGKNDGKIGTFSTPLVISTGGHDEIILAVGNKVRAFAPDTGRELWFADGMSPLVYTSPSYAQGTLVVMGGYMGSMMFLHPGGKGDVTPQRLVYERRMKKHVIGSPIVKDGHVYVGVTDGFAHCYDLATGKLLVEERLPATRGSSQLWATANLAGDKLYGVNQSGDTLIWRASPRFEMMATNSVGELSNSTLAMSNGELFLRTHAALYCIAEK